MPVPVDTLRLHLDYSAWATRRLLDAAAELPASDRVRDFGTADRSITGTLIHTFGGDRIWLARVTGNEKVGVPGPEFDDISVLREAWFAVGAQWKTWIESRTDQDILEVLAYRDLKGNPWRTPLWQIVLHVVNHATHHRGQAAGFLRTLGRTPPPLDLIAFYRQLSASASA